MTKKRNHSTPQDAQDIANQTLHTVLAPASVSSVTGTHVTATNRQNHPRPRPSASFQRFHATQRYVKLKSSVSAAALIEPASAAGPKARNSATSRVNEPTNTSMTVISLSPILPAARGR